jgi:hypothetical protein
MRIYYFHHFHTTSLSLYSPPSPGTNLLTGPILPSCFSFLKKSFFYVITVVLGVYDISMYL